MKNFIEMCIAKDFDKRPTASELRAHALMADLEGTGSAKRVDKLEPTKSAEESPAREMVVLQAHETETLPPEAAAGRRRRHWVAHHQRGDAVTRGTDRWRHGGQNHHRRFLRWHAPALPPPSPVPPPPPGRPTSRGVATSLVARTPLSIGGLSGRAAQGDRVHFRPGRGLGPFRSRRSCWSNVQDDFREKDLKIDIDTETAEKKIAETIREAVASYSEGGLGAAPQRAPSSHGSERGRRPGDPSMRSLQSGARSALRTPRRSGRCVARTPPPRSATASSRPRHR